MLEKAKPIISLGLAMVCLTATLMLTVPVMKASALDAYTVKSGDTLWKISQANGVSISNIKLYNSLSSDIIYPGQLLRLIPPTSYVVQKGDTLWLISQKFNTTVAVLKSLNNLTSDMIIIGQKLKLPTQSSTNVTARPQPVLYWPSVTYTVQPGDTAYCISQKFGIPANDILKYNYMTASDWFDTGDKIAINGFAPRNYAVLPGEDPAPSKVGRLVDWFLDGQYLIKRGNVFQITDAATGLSFQVKMLGGYNHSDIEPLTAADTAVMQKLFPTWEWTPRPVVIFSQNMNIAASLSGMPHSFDTLAGNNVTGHFDLYLYNSQPHGDASVAYVAQHQACVLKAAGK